MSNSFEILVTAGPCKGQRFAVAQGGRLGRSSSCEISICDPALSRNHCLFENRGGELFVTDLASANGTLVNDVQLGADSRALLIGDMITVGDTKLAIVLSGTELAKKHTGAPKMDLGPGGAGEEKAEWSVTNIVLWIIAIACVAAVAWMIYGDLCKGAGN